MAVVSRSCYDASGLHTPHPHRFKRGTTNVGTIIEYLHCKGTANSTFGMDRYARRLTPGTNFR